MDKFEKQPKSPECKVKSVEQTPLYDEAIPTREDFQTPTLKVPVVLTERKLQIVVEADIPLSPPATEIKRVTKNVFLEQVKLVPVRFLPLRGTDFLEVTRAKLYISGYIRKNIEYSTRFCHGSLQDMTANVPFSGFAEIDGLFDNGGDFTTFPIIGISDSSKAQFLNEKNNISPRLDKYFFQNLVKYNEQPYGELLGANFYELDFSPKMTEPGGEFSTLREKIVMDLYVKVLQVQQYSVGATRVLPIFDEGTLGS